MCSKSLLPSGHLVGPNGRSNGLGRLLMGKGMFEDTMLHLLLAHLSVLDFESECVHGSLCLVWSDPLNVFRCDVCGHISCPDFGAGTEMERELTRPFRDAWS